MEMRGSTRRARTKRRGHVRPLALRVCGNARARVELGWQPRFATFREGLPTVVEEFEQLAGSIAASA